MKCRRHFFTLQERRSARIALRSRILIYISLFIEMLYLKRLTRIWAGDRIKEETVDRTVDEKLRFCPVTKCGSDNKG